MQPTPPQAMPEIPRQSANYDGACTGMQQRQTVLPDADEATTAKTYRQNHRESSRKRPTPQTPTLSTNKLFDFQRLIYQPKRSLVYNAKKAYLSSKQGFFTVQTRLVCNTNNHCRKIKHENIQKKTRKRTFCYAKRFAHSAKND